MRISSLTKQQEDEIASFSQTFPGEWLQFKNHSKHRLFDVQILQTVQRWDKHRLAVTSRQERHRDMCVDEFNKNNLTTEEKQRQILGSPKLNKPNREVVVLSCTLLYYIYI